MNLAFYPKANFTDTQLKAIGAHPVEGTDLVVVRTQSPKMSIVSKLRESVIASTLTDMAINSPDILNALVQEQQDGWETTHLFMDPLASFDPEIQQAVLSPIGIVHIYRQYFFEFDSFLGPSVGHIWISPGGAVELFEVHTRRSTYEREVQTTTETVMRSETSTTEQDEISDAVKEENQQDISLGVSVSAGADWGVYEAEASTNFSLSNSQKSSEEAAHKRMRQQSEKLSSEIRRNFKTTFRTAVQVEDTSSRRHVLQNTSDKLANYEFRRKMRKVGVQVQRLGAQLCWQVYVVNLLQPKKLLVRQYRCTTY